MAEGNYLVGVDIGSSSIKLCQLKDVRGKRTLVKFGYYPLPSQTVVDGHVMNASAIIQGLNSLWSQLKLKRKECSLAVSGHAVIIRRLALPMMTQAELAEQIPWEAEQQIPYDIKDVQIDYEVLRRRPEQGQMDVLLVAAKKEEINDAAQVAREAKLKPAVVDVDAFTVQNAFEVNYGLPREGNVALINIGAGLTTVNILSGGIPAFTRSIVNGGNAITEEIQKRLGISWEEAEVYKTHAAGGQLDARAVVPAEVPQIIRQAVEQLSAEILRSLDFYLATSGEREIGRIYLSGGTANIPEMAVALERRAKAPVEPLDPFRDIAVDPKEVNTEQLNLHRAQVCVAIGLALRKDREKV
ncbi:MAG: type IV pilus assembly protein PilM [Myxococcales bacterium]|nr:type IV pilus assembly protein PilM [Myxococcales bacterium]